MSPPRKSCAILLTRGEREKLELYVVRRSPKLEFFGGYWALPGGVVDGEDRLEDDWSEERLHQSCGLRELFEETGVLPRGLAERIEPGARAALRAGLLERQDARAWHELLRGFPAALDELHPLGSLTTPAFAKRRYRTHFQQLSLPAGESPSISPGELTDGIFLSPAALLERWRAGEWLVVPPLLAFLDSYRADVGLGPWREALRERTRRSEAGSIHRIRHVPGIEVLPLRTPTLPPATTTNTYVVGGERLYVVDPATPHEDERARLFDFLDERQADGCRLAGILVTHHHHDHVASVAPLAERYELEVLATRETLERLPSAPRRSRELVDGDRIELGDAPDGRPGWFLEALHTPGHDRGHLVFLDSRYNSLIAGDLVSTVSTILIDPPEGHLATYLASLRRVLERAPAVIHPAHGMATSRGVELLRRYLAHRSMREAALVRALRSGTSELGELVALVYQEELPSEMRAVAQRSLLAGLEKLAEEGRALERDGRWHCV